jgi:RES domain
VIEQYARHQRADLVSKLAALPRESIEAILLKRGIDAESISEVRATLTSVDIVLDARGVVAYSFRPPYRVGRFGDGQIGVFYSGLEESTCIAEISYHHSQQLAEQRSGQFPHDRYYHLIVCNFSGVALMLLGEETNHPELTSPTVDGYPFCQRLGKEAASGGIDALYTRSARAKDGTCVPVFSHPTLSNPTVVGRFRFSSQNGDTVHEKLQP